ncbi:MAG: prepilin-type N-terminal cleavage/methylation domain-containing protein [Gemmatimonadales bacterium]|nr:prepilin-type N-terminal cleavage/methylation domain-containing protein [Gemmatimonadales bacterium]
MSMNRSGFSLIELLVALTLTAFVALLVSSILATAAWRLRDRSERMGLEQSIRVAAGAARALGEGLGGDGAGPDLTGLAPDAFVARATRASGVLCEAGTDAVVARSGQDWWSGTRAPAAGRDSLFVGSVDSTSTWHLVPLLGPPRAASCPDGAPGVAFATTIPPETLSRIGAGSPVRVVEPVEFRVYSSSGAQWIGQRLVATGEAIQPLAGPFAAGGVGFGYRGRGGMPAATPSEVSGLELRLGATTERAGGIGVARLAVARRDSIDLTVNLRNRP